VQTVQFVRDIREDQWEHCPSAKSTELAIKEVENAIKKIASRLDRLEARKSKMRDLCKSIGAANLQVNSKIRSIHQINNDILVSAKVNKH
jgi:flagellar hook-associated protein FlgK